MQTSICRFFLASVLTLSVVYAETVFNPTKIPYEEAIVRLKTPAPAGAFDVLQDGVSVPYQVEDGRIWVKVNLEPGKAAEFELNEGGARPRPTGSWLEEQGDRIILRNELIELHVSENPSKSGPILAYGPVGKAKLGGSSWHNGLTPLKVEAEVIGSTIFAKVRITSTFKEGTSTVTIWLPPKRPFAVIEETHNMRDGDGWTLHMGEGLNGAEGVLRRWYVAAFKGAGRDVERFPFKPGYTRMGERIINLQPRWTQGFDEGWMFGLLTPDTYTGAIVQRAGKWKWPHENLIQVWVDDSGKKADLFCPTRRGSRSWLLVVGSPDILPQAHSLVSREAFGNPDKLHNEYVLSRSGPKDKLVGIRDFYSNGTNPTGGLRRGFRGPAKQLDAGKTNHSIGTQYGAQVFFDPDWYGDLDDHWSPINPNFHTDFIKTGVFMACLLKGHPSFEKVKAEAIEALKKDIDYAVTLPGGAGQECPGYLQHGIRGWLKMAPYVKEHLGFDLTTLPRYQAATAFNARISQPAGEARLYHPAGDTHPGRPDPIVEAKDVYGLDIDPRRFVSEEFPGFGVILRNRPGTTRETFLSFKAGPNRGHFHGDQLSIHYCANAQPLAVDHHASYKPRPGQEHMHNRVAFSTADFAYANMDGFERLIAFTTSDTADVALAQVESQRLRQVKELPPEDWDVSEPQVRLSTPLKYTRGLILLKGEQDIVVILDTIEGPELTATYGLHVLGDKAEQNGNWVEFEGMKLFMADAGSKKFSTFPWEHENGGLEKTTAARFSSIGKTHRFLSVLIPKGAPDQVKEIATGLNINGQKLEFSADGGISLDGKPILRPSDINPDRSQGRVGLFVPDVGYPFGPIPDWLAKQRETADGPVK